MKQRYTYLDIRAIANELLIEPAYIQQVYAHSSKIFTFKLSTKKILLVEVGVRFHTVEESPLNSISSYFLTKMRQILRRNILVKIEQIGFDRILKLTTNKCYIFIEFFSGGNIVVTDFDYQIISLLRVVKEIELDIGCKYVFNPVELDFGYKMFSKGFKEMLSVDKIIFEDIREEFNQNLRAINYFLDQNNQIKRLAIQKNCENRGTYDLNFLQNNSAIITSLISVSESTVDMELSETFLNIQNEKEALQVNANSCKEIFTKNFNQDFVDVLCQLFERSLLGSILLSNRILSENNRDSKFFKTDIKRNTEAKMNSEESQKSKPSLDSVVFSRKINKNTTSKTNESIFHCISVTKQILKSFLEFFVKVSSHSLKNLLFLLTENQNIPQLQYLNRIIISIVLTVISFLKVSTNKEEGHFFENIFSFLFEKNSSEGLLDEEFYKLKLLIIKYSIDTSIFDLTSIDKNEIDNDLCFYTLYTLFFENLLLDFKNTANFGLLCGGPKFNNFVPYNIKKEIANTKKFNSFDEAVKSYFFTPQKKKEPISKSEKVKSRQENIIQNLEEEIKNLQYQIDALISNKSVVEDVFSVHKKVLDMRLDWNAFEKFKKEDKTISKYIKKSNFKNKTVVVVFQQIQDEGVEIDKRLTKKEKGTKNTKSLDIELQFCENFDKNINFLYMAKKKKAEKLQKTLSNIEKVVRTVSMIDKKAEKKIVVKNTRKKYWFEKFNYSFTSGGFLAIAGKSAQENDILVKKYLNNDDLFFHTETRGGSAVILINGRFSAFQDIYETALMALCLSACWKNKVAQSVFYVFKDQVSKTAETGEYLSQGSFIIRGKKNYVDVHKLEYAIGILFGVKKNLLEEDFENLNISVTQSQILESNSNKEQNGSLDFAKKCSKTSRFEKTSEIGGHFIDFSLINSANLDQKNSTENKSDIKYTLYPSEKDTIENCLVIGGPYEVFTNYKYKIKLIPSNDKKGKHVKTIHSEFVKLSRNTNEFPHVKKIHPDDIANVLIKDCKIAKIKNN